MSLNGTEQEFEPTVVPTQQDILVALDSDYKAKSRQITAIQAQQKRLASSFQDDDFKEAGKKTMDEEEAQINLALNDLKRIRDVCTLGEFGPFVPMETTQPGHIGLDRGFFNTFEVADNAEVVLAQGDGARLIAPMSRVKPGAYQNGGTMILQTPTQAKEFGVTIDMHVDGTTDRAHGQGVVMDPLPGNAYRIYYASPDINISSNSGDRSRVSKTNIVAPKQIVAGYFEVVVPQEEVRDDPNKTVILDDNQD